MITTVETTDPAVKIEACHIYRGTIRYFLCGPGSDAMFPCSEPVYEGRHPTMTPEETRTAHAALALLTERYSQDKDAGVPEIQQALADAAAGMVPAARRPRRFRERTPAPAPNPEPVTISAESIARVAAVVARYCSVPEAALYEKRHNLNSRRDARRMFISALEHLHPGARHHQISDLLNCARPSVSYMLDNHRNDLTARPHYRLQFQRILTALS